LVGLAPKGQRRNRLGRDCVPHQLPGRLPDQHLGWRSRLLQARGHVHGVAQYERAASRSAPGDHLPGVHPGAKLEGHAPVALQFLVEFGQGRLQLHRGPHRSQGVVLVQPGNAEHPNYGITDELLDRSLMPFQYLPHPLEILAHHPLERLRVQALAQRRGPRQVAEHDRDRFADLAAGGRIAHEWPATVPAETEAVWTRMATCGTGHHNGSLERRSGCVGG
jgi:hypothetical protein